MSKTHNIKTFIYLTVRQILSHRIWKYGFGIAILSGICIQTFHIYKKITRTPIWHYTIELTKSENIRIDTIDIALTFPNLWQNKEQKIKDNASEEKIIPPKDYLSIKFTYGIRGNTIMESQPYNYYISDKWILDSVYGYTKQTITFENNIGKQVTKKSELTNNKLDDSSIWHYDETKNMNPASSQNMFQFIDSEYTFYRAIANQYKDYFNICNEMYLHHPLNIWSSYNMSKICLEIQFTETSLKEIGKSVNITFQTPVELTNTYPQPEDNTFSHIKYSKSTSWEQINQNGISSIVCFTSYIPLQESRVYILTTIITLCISGIITLIIQLAYFHFKSIYDL